MGILYGLINKNLNIYTTYHIAQNFGNSVVEKYGRLLPETFWWKNWQTGYFAQ